MAERLEFICKYVYFTKLEYNTQTSRVPTQLFHQSRIIEFELRSSATINSLGNTLVQGEEVCLKWIRNYQFTEIRRRIKAGEMMVKKLSYLREYY